MKACLFQAANRSPFFTVLSDVSPNLLHGVYLKIPGIQKSGERGKAAMHITFPARQDFPPGKKRRDGTRIILYLHYKS